MRARRVGRIGGRNVLRLGKNPATQLLYRRIDHAPAERWAAFAELARYRGRFKAVKFSRDELYDRACIR